MKGICANLFSRYWNEGHFLLGNHLFMYNEKDLSNEAWYQKGQLVKFISNLGYVGGVTPVAEIDKKRLKCLIDIRYL